MFYYKRFPNHLRLKKAQVFDVKTLDATFSQIACSMHIFYLNAQRKEQGEGRARPGSCNEPLASQVCSPPPLLGGLVAVLTPYTLGTVSAAAETG